MKPADLKRWRKRLGLSQRAVAEIAGNSWRAWQSWEIGARAVPWYLRAVMEYVERQLRE